MMSCHQCRRCPSPERGMQIKFPVLKDVAHVCKDVTLRTALLYRSSAGAQSWPATVHTVHDMEQCDAGVVEQLYQHADEWRLCQQERRLALRYLAMDGAWIRCLFTSMYSEGRIEVDQRTGSATLASCSSALVTSRFTPAHRLTHAMRRWQWTQLRSAAVAGRCSMVCGIRLENAASEM
jgi:hypothetical protein